jgi:hypothetical protein
MQCVFRIACLSAFLLVACGRASLERKLIGAWSGCSIDICSTNTFRSDHTMGSRFDGDDSDSYSGTWRVEGDQVVIHVLQAGPGASDIVGKDLLWIIVDIQKDGFVTGYDKEHKLTWTRVK